mmetsp:Transcript_10982/g.33688  ORF Transcript_10982/g.33688 Transcript_10982/m.33688 type:complete len:318 (-) Transcript_10982:100-1053(-)
MAGSWLAAGRMSPMLSGCVFSTVQDPHKKTVVHRLKTLRSAALWFLAAVSSRRMYIAEQAAAPIERKSPALGGCPPSEQSSVVPKTAIPAEIQVILSTFLLYSVAARNGTIFTLRYKRNALFPAVVVRRPRDWSAYPANIQKPSSAPDFRLASDVCFLPLDFLLSRLSSLLPDDSRNGVRMPAATRNLEKFITSGLIPLASTVCLMTACCEPHITVTRFKRRNGTVLFTLRSPLRRCAPAPSPLSVSSNNCTFLLPFSGDCTELTATRSLPYELYRQSPVFTANFTHRPKGDDAPTKPASLLHERLCREHPTSLTLS